MQSLGHGRPAERIDRDEQEHFAVCLSTRSRDWAIMPCKHGR